MNEQVTPEEIDARNIVEGKVQATEEEKQQAVAFLAQVEADKKAADNITDEEEKKSFLTKAKEGWQNWKNKYVASGDDLGSQLQNQMGDAYDEKVDESIRKSEAMNKFAKGVAGATEAAGIDTNGSIEAIDETQDAIKNAGVAKKEGGNTQEALVNELNDVKEENKSAGETGSASKDAEEIVEDAVPNGDKNNRHYRAVKSIWSAYYDGDFGPPGSKEAKEVAWYYTIDSLAKLGNKIGKSLRNVGAAYTGGAIDTSEDEKSAWTEHQESLRKEASDISKENMGGSAGRQAVSENLRNEAQVLMNDKNATVKDLIDKYVQKMEEAGNPVSEQMYANLVANLAGSGMSMNDSLMSLGAGGLKLAFEKLGLKF